MFDTFDVLVPDLNLPAGFELRQHQTAFGPDDSVFLYVAEAQFARVLPAREAFSAVEAWTGVPGREGWTVLLLSAYANAATRDSGSWASFLAALRVILENHPVWRVTCESDCDQHPVETFVLAPGALVDLLDTYRNAAHYPIAFHAECGAL